MQRFIKSFTKGNKTLYEFIKYSMIGILSISIDFVVYNMCQYNFGISASRSKIFSYIVASTNSFVLNRKITFNSKVKSYWQPLKFLIVYLISLFFNSTVHDFVILFEEEYLPFF
ncbi:MAG: GtrA family protein [Gammaproteobacteria bacterium]